MAQHDNSAREDLLTRLMADYDDLLAAESLTSVVDESVVDADPELAQEWGAVKHCLDLLNRVRGQVECPSTLPGISSHSTVHAELTQGLMPRRLGHFEIQRELGRGGLGIVYLARDPRLQREVALKVPRLEALLDDTLRRRFLREAEAAARLSHPHLVTLLEVGQDGAICYLTSEFCNGPTLAQWLRQRTARVPDRQAAMLVADLADAVQHAHSRGVLHRDIKPSNVLLVSVVEPHDSTPEQLSDFSAKLTDFGMAKLLEETSQETRTGALLGTVAYMAPEQAEGQSRNIGTSTDVYALGAVLYEILTGQTVFPGDTEVVTLRKILLEEPTPIRRLQPDISRDLEAICLKCLEKDPRRRYPTAEGLATDLRRFLANEPTLARPLTSLQAIGKWARRRPAVATSMAVALCTLGILVVGAVTYTVRLREHALELSRLLAEKDAARAEAREAAATRDAAELQEAYPSDIRLAFEAWGRDDVDLALELLDHHRTRVEQEPNGAFAWHLVNRLCHEHRAALSGHQGPIYSVSYSPDGKWIASSGQDGLLRLWSVVEEKLTRSLQAHQAEIVCVRFSPNGKLMATASADQSVAIWEVATLQLIKLIKIPGIPIHSVEFHPDGKMLAAAGEDGVVRLWNTDDWTECGRLLGHDGTIEGLAISPDGTILASAGNDRTVRLWDLVELNQVAVLKGHLGQVRCVAFSHDGRTLASGSSDSSVQLWNVATREREATLSRQNAAVHHVVFTPDDRWILSVANDHRATFHEVETTTKGRVLRLDAREVYAVDISPDGQQIATGGTDELIRLWAGSPTPELERHPISDDGNSVAVSQDWRIAAVGDNFGKLRLYDMRTGSLLGQHSAHQKRVHAVAFFPDGKRLVTGDETQLRLWQLPDFQLLQTFTGFQARANSASISPDESLLAAGDFGATVRVWNTADWSLRSTMHAKRNEIVFLNFSPDGRFLAVISGEFISVFRTGDGSEYATFESHAGVYESIAWSQDNTMLAGGTRNGRVLIWRVNSCDLVGELAASQGRIQSVAFSPDGKTLVTGSRDKSIKLWDLETQEMSLEFDRHKNIVSALGFHATGDRFFSFGHGKICELFVWRSKDSELPAVAEGK